MKIAQTIINLHLSPKGGVYRTLPLLSESCVAKGYGDLLQRIAGLTYGPSGAWGNAKGLHTMYDIEAVVERVARKINGSTRWIAHTRSHASKVCRTFKDSFERNRTYAHVHPERFLRFIIREYPKYMAGIGAFNIFWRYLEFAAADMPRFPQKGLRVLSIERNKIAEIYPQCEHDLRVASAAMGKKLGIGPRMLLMMTRKELSKTLTTTRLAVSKKVLTQRAKGYIYAWINGREHVTTDSRERAMLNVYVAAKRKTHVSGDLHGVSVSPGRIVGTVVKQIKQTSWPKASILVTPMTHPSDIPYLKRIN